MKRNDSLNVIKRIMAIMLCAFISFAYFPTSIFVNGEVYAEDNNSNGELPFTIHDTDYGIEDDSAEAQKIRITTYREKICATTFGCACTDRMKIWCGL